MSGQAASRQVDAILSELGFKPHEWFLGGSGPMALRDMRPVGDIDIGVTTEYWFELWSGSDWGIYTPLPNLPSERCDPPYLYKTIQGVEVHVFFAWRLRERQPAWGSDYNLIFEHHLERLWRDHFTRAWPCVRLGHLLTLKAQEQREKDIPDIAQIARQIIEEGVS